MLVIPNVPLSFPVVIFNFILLKKQVDLRYISEFKKNPSYVIWFETLHFAFIFIIKYCTIRVNWSKSCDNLIGRYYVKVIERQK